MSNEVKTPNSSSKNPLTWGRVVGQSASFGLGELAVNRMANSFGSGLDKLKDSLSLKEFLPNMDVLLTMSNFKTALLAIHLGASLIDFPDQSTHPNKNGFVRAVASFDNFLHHEPEHNLNLANSLHRSVQNAINFTAPLAIHTAPNLIYSSADIIKNKEEHPILSNALLVLGVMGGLHFLNDIFKITAKYIETTTGKKKIVRSKDLVVRRKSLNPEWRNTLNKGKLFKDDQRLEAHEKTKIVEQAAEDYINEQTSLGQIDYLVRNPGDRITPHSKSSIRKLVDERSDERLEELRKPKFLR